MNYENMKWERKMALLFTAILTSSKLLSQIRQIQTKSLNYLYFKVSIKTLDFHGKRLKFNHNQSHLWTKTIHSVDCRKIFYNYIGYFQIKL